MKYSLEIENKKIRISYVENQYLLRRVATQMAFAIEDQKKLSEAFEGLSFSIALDDTLSPESFSVTVEQDAIKLCAANYLGFDGLMRSLFCDGTLREKLKKEGFSYVGSYKDTLTALDASCAYAYQKEGNLRLMSFNVLFEDRVICERNILQASIVETYMPDVLGLQECSDRNRMTAYHWNLPKLLGELGYKESYHDRVMGTYRKYNVSPLFYNTKTTQLQYSEVAVFQTQNPKDETRMMTWGVFLSKESGKRYVVINAQLCGGDPVVGLGQVQEMEKLVNRFHDTYSDAPIFVIGDTNLVKKYNTYRYIMEDAKWLAMRDLATVHRATAMSHHPYPDYDARMGMVCSTGGACDDHDDVESFDRMFLAIGEANIKTFGVCVDSFTLAASDHFPIFSDVVLK